MILQKLINLKPGDKFKFRGEIATVVWREYSIEEVGEWDGVMKYSKHFGMCYTFLDKTHSLRSMWPHPESLNLSEYSEIDKDSKDKTIRI